jgi:hypothetical protein
MGKHMTDTEIQALDRRNSLDQELVLTELKEIKKISRNNEKTNLVLAGDMKEVKRHLSGINGSINEHDVNFADLNTLLRGEGKDDAGVVGEQLALGNYVFKDLKPSIDKLSYWFLTLVLGLIITGIVSTVLSQ